MFSYVFGSASTYFHLPIEEDEDEDDFIPSSTRHISWASPDTTLVDCDTIPSSIPSSTSSQSQPGSSKPRELHSQGPSAKNKAVINEILAQDDCYAVLGISRSTRIDKLTLRRAYLARSKSCHPDKFPDNPEATRAFQKVSVAYDILSKPSSKRMYDSRPTQAPFDFFASRTFQAEETFRGVVIGVINDMLDGDLEMIRTLLFAVNNMNPSLQLGEEGINSVLMTLQAIRTRALTCRTCIHALHNEVSRLLEAQRAFRQLSYFDLRRRSHLMIHIARLTISMPIALEEALRQQKQEDYGRDALRENQTALLNRRIYALLRGVVSVLERMEGLVKK
ncbi:DnaJ-domain-containing protein [Dichomitus squalens LYAD-421 SS1]|uniref:DnaJ-domain-containing protein n=2 Tax=Dichomitus squalens TaxID=114155 RepID=A0A4Q9M8M3_9APHY|nr:DnaJ-domain-containing protein [Dichomitus squalens LYAD-421 SS1]EJF55860.1 DnaJ-domain-containing protein [Dichomitus squalens LYAD-421 SS1]TBU22242.1 DnaJ-domain-containing protein [Dichomitus squalens]